METIPLIVKVLVMLTIVPAVCFPIYYAFQRWSMTLPGRAVMVQSAALMVIMIPVFTLIVLERPLPEWIRIIIWALLAIGLWTMLISLLVVSRRSYRPWYHRRRDDEPSTYRDETSDRLR